METKTRASKHQVRHPHCPGIWSLVGTYLYGLTQDIKDNVFTHTDILEYCTLTHISCTALRQIRGDKKKTNSPTNKTEGGGSKIRFCLHINNFIFTGSCVWFSLGVWIAGLELLDQRKIWYPVQGHRAAWITGKRKTLLPRGPWRQGEGVVWGARQRLFQLQQQI